MTEQAAYAPPPMPPLRPTPRWIIAAIIAGVVIVIGGLVVALIAVLSLLPPLTENLFPQAGPEPAPLVTGEPSSPFAVDPVECVDACFDTAVTQATIASVGALATLGVPQTDLGWRMLEPSNAGIEYRNALESWNSVDADDPQCFFTWAQVPLAADYGERPDDEGVIDFTGTNIDDERTSSLSQTIRFFASSDSAADHMRALDTLIDGCPYYEFGAGDEWWWGTVSKAPALTLPDTVAATGWRESAEGASYYVFDLQYGNIVVRSILSSETISEADYRAFVEGVAQQLAEIPLPVG